jgi:PAS domain S-box-containing protein
METTFITIHDLTSEARILYASDSVVDILGHTPDEVVNKSSWEFFHPAELPLAKQLHNRGVNLDKAAVLSYCQLRNRQGQWVGCECCFTVVYDVMVVCTSIYRRDMTSQKRADQAPIVRRLFSSSPKDPRYHMLQQLSAKFQRDIDDQTHEPRAALFLNRFTRTLTVMYATNGIEEVIGIPGEEMKGRSFYFCIAETCLEDAVKCVESAKGNDSIAYLRFRFRDPRQNDASDQTTSDEETDAGSTGAAISEDESGASVGSTRSPDAPSSGPSSGPGRATDSRADAADTDANTLPDESSRNSSGASLPQTSNTVFDERASSTSALSSAPTSPEISSAGGDHTIELEAVISCTSDGLVVILRRARPLIPGAGQNPNAPAEVQHGFIGVAPWSHNPVYFPPQPVARTGPAEEAFMNSVREVAVFAWGLVGINGSLEEYSRGQPQGESQPAGGFPVWDGTFASPDDSGHASASHTPEVSATVGTTP